MKNIADVNTDDILLELNNLDYDDSEDLKLLDDEEIKPISNKSNEVDLSNFYNNYEPKKEAVTTSKVNMYTEKEEVKKDEKQFTELKTNVPSQKATSLDSYLNRNNKENHNNSINYQNNSKPQAKEEISKPNSSMELNQLFNKVSSNVKGASEIVNRNAEIKRKIEEKFNDLKRLQQQHEENKKKDYDEINAYRDEVYSKIQQKKADFEKDYSAIKNEQDKLEKEKRSFEEYKNTSLANLNKLEKELKESYESRTKNIEQVEIGLVKRKEQLDIERANLAKEKESIQQEREELAKNLVQFNKLVSEFTNGVQSF